MFKWQVKFGLLVYAVALISCHSHAPKVAVQSVQKKDTVKAVVQKKDTASAIVPVKVTKQVYNSYVILDTLVGNDTLKVVLYNNTMIRCSINNLADTFNAAPNYEQWDTSYSGYSNQNIAPIILPEVKNPVKFILNDSLLILPIASSSPTGGMLLYFLNRTKTSLTFAQADGANPICHRPYYIYVDLKNNTIIDHDSREIYDDEENAGDGENGRYIIFKYKISNKHFVRTDGVASYFKEFDSLDMLVPEEKEARIFYATIARRENWKRDRYDSDAIQKVVVIDTRVGKDKINVYYDNKGNIVCKVNNLCDTALWDEKWEGYEWWRNNDFRRIIVPGENKPSSFVLNDSVLLFTTVDANGWADLYLFNIKDTTLETDLIDDYTNYIYVDLKSNMILNYVDTISSEESDMHSNDVMQDIDVYEIHNSEFIKKATMDCSYSSYDDLPYSFEDFNTLYKYSGQQGKEWIKRIPYQIVIDYIKRYFYNWYFYYEFYLSQNAG